MERVERDREHAMDGRWSRNALLHGALALVAAFPGLLAAQAQNWPAKPVTLIAPSAPGSSVDVTARLVAQKVSEQLSQQVVVFNRAGAGTNIGSEVALNSAADGYTALLGSVANTINLHLVKNSRYTLDDMGPVSGVSIAPDMLVLPPTSRIAGVKELVDMLKAKPGTPAGHSGIGTVPYMSLQKFRLMTGVEITMVPFVGGAAVSQGILSGEVAFMFRSTMGTLPMVTSGQLRTLGITSKNRIAVAPNIPTLSEAGLPGFESLLWFGIFLPSKTPKAIVDRLSAEVQKAVASPALTKRLMDLGAEPMPSSPEVFGAFVKSEYERWGKLIQEAGIRVE
jgi:tripartite-type tricarboxylate transporter receptor subunit TctC